MELSKFSQEELKTILKMAKRYRWFKVIRDVVNELSEREWGLDERTEAI